MGKKQRRRRTTSRRRTPQVELLEPRQLLTSDPIVVDIDHLRDFEDPDNQHTSLREALVIAKENPGPDLITFAPNLNYGTIVATGGELVVDSDVTIDASSAGLLRIGREVGTIADHRIFRVTADANVVIENVIIQGGQAGSSNATRPDPTLYGGIHGGGIYNEGSLRLIDTVVGGNRQFTIIRFDSNLRIETLGGGGGIFNASTGDLQLINSHVGDFNIDEELLLDLGLNPEELPKSLSGKRALVPNNIAQGVGGAILNRGKLTISADSTLAYNWSNYHSGGIYNTGTLVVEDSELVGNRMLGSGTDERDGGAIASSNRIPVTRRDNFRGNVDDPRNGYSYETVENPVDLRINRSVIDANRVSADSDAVIFAEHGPLRITDSEVIDNEGSGVKVVTGATGIVSRSLVSGNKTGIVAISSRVRVDGSTVVNNSNRGVTNVLGTTEIFSSTISQNATGGVVSSGGVDRLYNSIIAGNSAQDYSRTDIFGNQESLGFNLFGTTSRLTLSDTDVVNSDPQLGPLGDHGGATRTLGLLPTSPALNNGAPTIKLGSAVSDQRGEPRIVGPRADIGAFESQPLLRMEVDNLSPISDGYYAPGQVSLGDAVAWANAIPGPDTIVFSEELLKQIEQDPELDGQATIALDSQLHITDDLTIIGPGADVLTISGQDLHRVFLVDEVSFDLRDITLADGNAAGGGAIRSSGDLKLSGVEVRDSRSSGQGGGIWTGPGSTLTMVSSTVAENTADLGGGLYVLGDATFENSTIAMNGARVGGGLVFGEGSENSTPTEISLNFVTIVGNHASQSAGGFRADASVTMSNTVVANNSASRDPDYSDGPDLISNGFNFVGDIDTASSPARSFDPENGDIVGGGSFGDAIDPLLGPLRYLGGPTRSVGILPTSPLIDNANPDADTAVDQRGIARPFGERNDIGAFEYIPPTITDGVITVDSLDSVADGYFAAGELSLTEAVLLAEEDTEGNTIQFDPALFVDELGEEVAGEIAPDRLLHIADGLEIVGPGADLLTIKRGLSETASIVEVAEAGDAGLSGLTIDGDDQTRLITNTGHLALRRTFLTNGNADRGAGLLNMGSAEVHQSTFANHESITFFGDIVSEEAFGGAVHNLGQFEAFNSTFSSNEGGGIWNMQGGEVRLQQSTVANNIDAGIGNHGTVSLQSSIVAANDTNIANFATTESINSEGHNLIGSESWLDRVALAGAKFVETDIAEPTQRDIGVYDESTGGGITYEFIYTGADSPTNSALMGSAASPIGDSGAFKSEQWRNTGNYGVTQYGVRDHNSGVRQIVNRRTHVVFVVNGQDAVLYVNGFRRDSMSGASINLSGLVGIGHAYRHSNEQGFDVLDGTIHGVAVYDHALAANEIQLHADAALSNQSQLSFLESDIRNPKPQLTELVSIKGSIPMHGLLPSSPAIDAGANVGEAVDQRGQSRPLQEANDIGAFEAKEHFWDDELVVTDLSDRLDAEYEEGLSLREAILWANRKDATNPSEDGMDRIVFAPELIDQIRESFEADESVTTIELRDYEDPDLIISAPLELSPFANDVEDVPANLLEITTNGAHRIFTVLDNAGSVVIDDVSVFGGGNVQLGGGIYTASDLELNNVTVRDNASGRFGGGIVATGNATLLVDHGDIRNNTSAEGGGIFGGVNSTIDLAYTAIEKNHATGGGDTNGGGLLSTGEVVVMSSTFAENSGGWAISNVRDPRRARLSLDNVTVSGNQNGAIRAHAADVTNSTIYDNDGSALKTGERQTRFYNSISHNNGVDDIETTGQLILRGSLVNPSTDPMLQPLEDNGGPTRTHALGPESPAIDAGDARYTPILDQRGRPMVDIPSIVGASEGNIVDIGAYEVQSIVLSEWDYSARGQSQFGEGEADVFGFGFDDGTNSGLVETDPLFLGIPFDTGPLPFGGIEDVLGAKFGAQVQADFAGRVGFDFGLYVNSGSVDVDYGGMLNYVVDEDPTSGTIDVATFFDVDDGSLYTLSPKIGAYMDLVLELDASLSATGCLFGCVEFDVPFKVDETTELFALNRQKRDDDGNPLFVDAEGNLLSRFGNAFRNDKGETVNPDPPPSPFFDGDIRFGEGSLSPIANRDSDVEIEFGAADRVREADRKKAAADQEWDRYAAEARRQGYDPNDVPPNGNLAKRREAAIDGIIAADKEKKQVDADLKEGHTECNGKRSIRKNRPVKKGLDISFGEAAGSLLGAQATIAASAELDIGNCQQLGLSKDIGSIAVTLPDINLSDKTPEGAKGKLSATTSDFVKGSELDEKRQLVNMQLDAGGLLGPLLGIPAGKYGASIGPLAITAQLVSYNIGPQLNVTQDVDAEWYAKRVTFDLDADLVPSVLIDGEPAMLDDAWQFSFTPGQDVKITPHEDSESKITVNPSLTMDAKFENDLGLDIDLQGALEALSFNLQVAGQTIVDVGPLITEKHNLATLDLGSIFKREWDLFEKTQELPSFEIGGRAQDGKTASSAFMAEVAPENELTSIVAIAEVDPNAPMFFAKELVSRDAGNAVFHNEVTYSVDANAFRSIYVLQDDLTVEFVDANGTRRSFEPRMGRQASLGNVTSIVVSGFDTQLLAESTRAVVGFKFDNDDAPVNVSMTLGGQTVDVTDQVAGDSGNLSRLFDTSIDNLVTTAIVGFDVDGDGKESPLTDGVLLMQYMDGEGLSESAVGVNATRSVEEIVEYIDETLDRIELTEAGDSYRTLDIDGDGVVSSSTDGVMISRYLAGFNGTVLIANAVGNDAVRTSASDIREFLRFGRVTTNDAEVELRNENDELVTSQGSGFDDVLDYRDIDLFGITDALDASNAASGASSGNATAGNKGVTAARGASAESATTARSSRMSRAGDLQTFEFELSNFGETIEYDELYLVNDGDEELDKEVHELVSRVAVGAPANFANEKYADLSEDDVEKRLRRSSSMSTLGIDEPIFVQAPDAAGYTYSTTGGHSFKEVVIDTQVGDNGYLSGGFDLYRGASSRDADSVKWEFEAFIEAGNPLFDAGDGILRYELSSPLQTFRLFPTALPSVDIHQADNIAAPELFTTTGFMLIPPAKSSSAPTVEMTQVAHRLPPNDPPTISLPVHLGTDLSNASHSFSIRRDAESMLVGAVRDYSSWGPILQKSQLASANRITIDGSDNANDSLSIDVSQGPIHTPIDFNGGQRTDTVRFVGGGIHLDLTDSDHQFANVEVFDIGGTGVNSLRLDIDVLREIGAEENTFTVLGNDNANDIEVDRLSVGEGWRFVGLQSGSQGNSFSVYEQDEMTLLVSGGIRFETNTLDDPEPLPPSNGNGTSILHQSVTLIEQPSQPAPLVRLVKSKSQKSTSSDEKAVRSVTSLESTFSSTELLAAETTRLVTTARFDGRSSGLQFRVHYDSTQIDLERTVEGIPIISLTNVFADGLLGVQVSTDCIVTEDENGEREEFCHGIDGVEETDTFVNFLWLDHAEQWPVSGTQVAELLSLIFVAQDDFDGTTVHFSGDLAGGVDLEVAEQNLETRNLTDGDLNQDSQTDSSDIDFLFAAIREENDGGPGINSLDDDAVLDQRDVDYLLTEIFRTKRGDANLDRKVDFADFLILARNFDKEDSEWADGDFDGDGKVAFLDFLMLAENFDGE